jgi:hypothetical protein
MANGFANRYQQDSGGHYFYSAASGTAGNDITFSLALNVNKDLTLQLQGATQTSGTGIAFPATQSASSDANTLDDYEEGTWTPNDASGAGLSLTVSIATYVKIGKIVILSYNLSYPSTANGSSAILGGLPFTVSPSTNNNWMGGIVHWNNNSRNLTNMALGQTSQATFRNNVNATDPTNANLSNCNFRGNIIYEAS